MLELSEVPSASGVPGVSRVPEKGNDRPPSAPVAAEGERLAASDHLVNNLDHFQAEVAAWAEATFGEGTTTTLLAHLIKEVRELWDTQEPEEAADVFILLLHFAHKRGFSLFDEAQRKFAVNKGRVWGEPDEDGVIEHVRGS